MVSAPLCALAGAARGPARVHARGRAPRAVARHTASGGKDEPPRTREAGESIDCASGDTPNIVIVAVDTLRLDHLCAYSSGRNH
jgi:hypothetical protein